MKIVTKNIYDCEPEAFWAHHLDEDSRRVKEVDGCGAESFKVLSRHREGGVVVVRSELIEAPDVPAAVRRVFGATMRAEEVLRYDEATGTATFEHTPDTMPDRVRLKGRLTAEPCGEGQCLLVTEFDVRVKVFGVAGVLERVLASELPNRQEKAMHWFNANLGEKASA